MVGSKSVFLSYASQDADAAGRLGAALRAAGVDVWFDQEALRGGDVWDQNIRTHIRECRLFVPLISRAASERGEGYFRLEWKLAVDRSHLMAPDQPFIVPVVIDDTTPQAARVPERFHDYQWSRLPHGEVTPAFVQRLGALAAGASGASNLPASASPPGDGLQPSRPRRGAARWIAVPLLALLAAVALFLGLRHKTVVPYSAEDRRMTFAVLPFVTAGGAAAPDVAAANTEACTAALERNPIWAHAADRGAVRDVSARVTGLHNIARALDVHYLVRGTISRSADGYSIDLAVVDGGNERTLGSESLTVKQPSLVPASADDYDDDLASLIYSALQAEVQDAAQRAESDLDVRDLTFRAYVYYQQHHGMQAREGYETAQQLLERALALSPDDHLALMATAEINLCDCLDGWMTDTSKATALGAAAVDRLARLDGNHPPRRLRLKVLYLQGRWAEMLSASESELQKDPDDTDFMVNKIVALLHLGRATEALSVTPSLERRNLHASAGVPNLIAAVEYAAGQYAAAVRHAQMASASMSAEEMRNPVDGSVRLTQAAAEARLGQLDQAHTTLQAFWNSVPEARDLPAIRRWMRSTAALYGHEPLFEGLRLAGVPD